MGGVSYVVVPLTKMVRQDGSVVVRDPISTDTAAESTLSLDLSSATASVYLLNNPLSASTVDGGGEGGKFVGVFQDDYPLDLLPPTSSLDSLGTAAGKAYIIGSSGAVINGISDDETLRSEGYITSDAITARRLELTANRIVVSLTVGEAPSDYKYAATYVCEGSIGAHNIDPGGAEYLSLGNVVITYSSES